MTVSERIPFSGLLLPLQEGHTYSCDRCTTDGMELLFVFRENGHSRYYFESDMQGFDRKAASDSHILTVYPQPNGDGEVSLLHLKRAATDRFFLFRMTKPCVTLTGKMIAEATGLQVQRFLAGVQGGDQQIASRIACNEVDLLLFFRDPINAKPSEPNEMTLLRLCDVHNIPLATNIATAEVLIHGLERGDLDWRDIVHPQN